jgi:hypothetical protein
MADQTSKKTSPTTDEIDLGQLFRGIGRGFKSLFNGFLRIFLYLKGRIVILLVLAVVGLAMGYGLSKIISKKQKIVVIVKPNWESKDYLYDVINEVQANLEAKDTSFFRGINVEMTNFAGFEIAIEPVGNKIDTPKDEIAYLELLQKFENTGMITDVLRVELMSMSSLNHRITFSYKDKKKGPIFAEQVMKYINGNDFFTEYVAISRQNAELKINENTELIRQIDQIITNYSGKMAATGNSAEGRIVLDNEEGLDITSLLQFKNNLIRDTEQKKIDLLDQKEAIRIVNFGKPQEEQKSFFGKKIILVPTLLIGLFLLIDFIKYLNRKALEIQQG